MDADTRIRLWNHSHVQIIDVRHIVLSSRQQLNHYRLPSSALLYVVDGQAAIQWDELHMKAKANMLLHGGKGISISIHAEESFHYFLILYRAALPMLATRELHRLLEQENPFQEQFSFVCAHPALMQRKLLEMEAAWSSPHTRSRLLTRSLFYHIIHEVLRQLEEQKVEIAAPDPIYQAVRYIEQHYMESITLEHLAEQLQCSARMLLRKFKAAFQTTPIDYLISVRLEQAKKLLIESSLSIKDISHSVGYDDYYYFSRLFKKNTGLSPVKYRMLRENDRQMPYNPSLLSISSIAEKTVQRYVIKEIKNHSQYTKKGELSMYSKSRRSLAIMAICLVMLLSACGGGTTNSKANNGGNAATNSNAATTPSAAAGDSNAAEGNSADTRVVKHAMGEETIVGTPERVVILTNEGTEALLAVGVKPVGAVQSWVGDPWYEHIAESMEGVEVVGDELQPNIELIASLKPDLIIGNKVRQEKIYEQLKEIAPTVFSEDLAGDWKINFDLYMEALGKQEEGEQLMAEFDKRVAEASVKLADKLDTEVSIVRFTASQVRIYQKQTFSGVLLEQLGFARPAAQDKDAFIEVMSKETIPSMDGDVMFYFVSEEPGKTDAAKVVEEWMNDPLFKNLNVVKNNKVIQVDEGIWNTAGGYKAANLLLDEIIAYFEK